MSNATESPTDAATEPTRGPVGPVGGARRVASGPRAARWTRLPRRSAKLARRCVGHTSGFRHASAIDGGRRDTGCDQHREHDDHLATPAALRPGTGRLTTPAWAWAWARLLGAHLTRSAASRGGRTHRRGRQDRRRRTRRRGGRNGNELLAGTFDARVRLDLPRRFR